MVRDVPWLLLLSQQQAKMKGMTVLQVSISDLEKRRKMKTKSEKSFQDYSRADLTSYGIAKSGIQPRRGGPHMNTGSKVDGCSYSGG